MAIPKAAKLRAEQSVAASIAQADAVVTLADADGDKARAELLATLRAADKRLALKLATMTPPGKEGLRFTAAQAVAYRTQIQLMIQQVEGKVGPIAVSVGTKAVAKSVSQGQALLGKLERDFKGVTASPSMMAAMQQSHVLRGPKAALVTRVATSLDRYGHEMGRQFSSIIATGLASGASNAEMVAQLVGHGGPRGPKVSLAAREVAPGVVQRIREGDIPEGLFVRHRYWAERLVRTEVAYAYSSTRFASLKAMRDAGHDVKKKIVAVFDPRTAPDSIAVHGQVRELDEPFVDGAGRVYLHPPGRPNDRETIIPWFEDYEELPSTEPPTPSEVERAEDLATPEPPAHLTEVAPPEDLEQLAELKARAAAAERQAEAEQVALEQKQALERDRQTRAAELLLAHEREKAKAAQDLVAQIAEAKRAQEEAAKQKKLAKVEKEIRTQLKGKEPHLATLRLYELAGVDPEGFATMINGFQTTPLPHHAITTSIEQHHLVLDSLVKDTVSGYAKLLGLKADEAVGALEAWKKDPAFAGWLDALAAKKDAKSKRLLASLVHSEQPLFLDPAATKKALTWKQSAALSKKPAAIAKLKSKYEKPAGPTWVVKQNGDYWDLVDPATNKKLGYYKQTTGGKFVVDPAGKLDPVKWTKQTFNTAEAAAAYAAQVGAAIQAQPVLPQFKTLDTTSTKRFNWVEKQLPTTKLGPLEIRDKAVAKQIERDKAAARRHFAAEGLKTRGTEHDRGVGAMNGVDEVLAKQGLTAEQYAWSGRYRGCWYQSSRGPKAHAGRFVALEASYDFSAVGEDGFQHHTLAKDARAAAKQLADEHHAGIEDTDAQGEKLVRYARAKYAATQAALEHRIARGELAHLIDKDGYITLHRGIAGIMAQKARKNRTEGAHTTVAMRSVSSWSLKRKAALKFTDSTNIVLVARVHYSRVFSQYEAEEIAMRRFGDEEAEWIVISEDLQFVFDSTDISNGKPE